MSTNSAIDKYIEENIGKLSADKFIHRLKWSSNFREHLSTENINTIINNYNIDANELAKNLFEFGVLPVDILINFIDAGLDMNHALYGASYFVTLSSEKAIFYILDNYNISDRAWENILSKNSSEMLKKMLKYNIPQSVLDKVCLDNLIYDSYDQAAILIENGANILLDKFTESICDSNRKNSITEIVKELKKLEDCGVDIAKLLSLKICYNNEFEDLSDDIGMFSFD